MVDLPFLSVLDSLTAPKLLLDQRELGMVVSNHNIPVIQFAFFSRDVEEIQMYRRGQD